MKASRFSSSFLTVALSFARNAATRLRPSTSAPDTSTEVVEPDLDAEPPIAAWTPYGPEFFVIHSLARKGDLE